MTILGKDTEIQLPSQVYIPGPKVSLNRRPTTCITKQSEPRSGCAHHWPSVSGHQFDKSLCGRQVLSQDGTFFFSHHDIPREVPISLGVCCFNSLTVILRDTRVLSECLYFYQAG